MTGDGCPHNKLPVHFAPCPLQHCRSAKERARAHCGGVTPPRRNHHTLHCSTQHHTLALSLHTRTHTPPFFAFFSSPHSLRQQRSPLSIPDSHSRHGQVACIFTRSFSLSSFLSPSLPLPFSLSLSFSALVSVSTGHEASPAR